jgi:hypothetical protein
MGWGFAGGRLGRFLGAGAGFAGGRFLGAGFAGGRFLGAGFAGGRFLGAGFDAGRFLGTGFDAGRFLGTGRLAGTARRDPRAFWGPRRLLEARERGDLRATLCLPHLPDAVRGDAPRRIVGVRGVGVPGNRDRHAGFT